MLVSKLFVGAIFSRKTRACYTGDLVTQHYVIIEVDEESGRVIAISFNNLYEEDLAEEFQLHEIEEVAFGIVQASDLDRVREEYGEDRLVPIMTGKSNFFLNPKNAETIGRTHAWIQSNWNFRQLALKKGWY